MGIHCRFGMRGVIAENHFDLSRNAIALLAGRRRYILAHPSQCSSMNLLPRGHPSARHSAVDWSNPDLEEFPTFADARVNEIVMMPGDVLYLPTNWFHFIVSLELNMQCNTRSGGEDMNREEITNCGF
jgi:ribosomal protein L16 Arg81 hydroxylase